MIYKAIIFDSSSIITLALYSMLHVLEPLKKSLGGKFLITPQVKREIVDSPIQQKRFELEALMISDLLEKEILEISFPKNLDKEAEGMLETANSVFIAGDEKMKIMHAGEASCFALAKILSSEYQIFLAIDERTSRVLTENPDNLHELFENKLHTKIKFNRLKAESFSEFNILRSSEILFLAYKKGLISLPAAKQQAIDALLYAAKFKGCSISFREIEKAKKII